MHKPIALGLLASSLALGLEPAGRAADESAGTNGRSVCHDDWLPDSMITTVNPDGSHPTAAARRMSTLRIRSDGSCDGQCGAPTGGH